jgi:hypothetical protein
MTLASAPEALAAMAMALKAPVMNIIFNIERNETISGQIKTKLHCVMTSAPPN